MDWHVQVYRGGYGRRQVVWGNGGRHTTHTQQRMVHATATGLEQRWAKAPNTTTPQTFHLPNDVTRSMDNDRATKPQLDRGSQHLMEHGMVTQQLEVEKQQHWQAC